MDWHGQRIVSLEAKRRTYLPIHFAMTSNDFLRDVPWVRVLDVPGSAFAWTGSGVVWPINRLDPRKIKARKYLIAVIV
jgi:hypothetical protein